MEKKITSKVYLALFTNKETGETILSVCGDIYDILTWSFMKTELEYKDLSNDLLEKNWVVEKKTKTISW